MPTAFDGGDNNHPVDLSPTKIAFSRDPMRRHPSAEGNFGLRRHVPSSPPLGVSQHRAPRDVSRGWLGRGGIPRRRRGQHLHSKLYTLHSIIPAHTQKIRRTADSPHTEYKPDSVPPRAPFPTPSVASIISLHTMLPRCVYALYPPPCARDSLQGPI